MLQIIFNWWSENLSKFSFVQCEPLQTDENRWQALSCDRRFLEVHRKLFLHAKFNLKRAVPSENPSNPRTLGRNKCGDGGINTVYELWPENPRSSVDYLWVNLPTPSLNFFGVNNHRCCLYGPWFTVTLWLCSRWYGSCHEQIDH